MNKLKKTPLWLPYLKSAKVNKNGICTFIYNGGEVTEDLRNISSIMIYGETEYSLPNKMISDITKRGIPILLHNRHISTPTIITRGLRPDPDDTITQQILHRENDKTKLHITRNLLTAKFKSSTWLVQHIPYMPQHATLLELRNIEAVHAKRYWHNFFIQLGAPNYSRRNENPYKHALDAISKFVSSIILRWCLYHHLSPYHGYLHEQTTYPALVYDLFEPYRSIFDLELLRVWSGLGLTTDINRITTVGVSVAKDVLAQQVYVPLTRQIVTRQELLHGVVLSLKFYLLKKQKYFLIPQEGKPNGGRPPQVEFLLYGRHAGKTDFWKQATLVSKNSIFK